MTLRPFFEWMDALESSIVMRESLNAYPIFLTVHVLSMCLFGGLIAFWDLRLVGLTLKEARVSDVRKRVFPWLYTGFAISAITGLLLFYSQPMRYFGNFYFWIKFGMFILAGVNILVFDLTIYKSVAKWDRDAVAPRSARLAGFASLVLWAGTVVTGRLIAYSGLVPRWWKDLGLS